MRFVIPAKKALESLDNSLSFEVIDSSFGKLPYEEVLESIREASCLIITSDSEGTCLPLIEACALGTPVVTFNVGIASELLIDELQSQISPRNLQIFTELIMETLSNRDEISRRCILRFDSYRHSVEADLHQLNFTTDTKGRWREARVERFWRNSLYWKLRWLKNFTKVS
jgi:glycosyltransferase involved in cell wall biosynthesis